VKKSNKFIRFISVWGLIVVFLTSIELYLGETLISALFLPTYIFILYLILLIINRIILRIRAGQRVKLLIDSSKEDDETIPEKKGLFKKKKQEILFYKNHLTSQFKILVSQIKKSKTDPVNEIPFFLLIGPDTSEKSETLIHAKLSKPDYEFDFNILQDVNLWPYDKGVILDLSEKYIINSNKFEYEQWLHLINLIKKNKKTESLSGIIIAIDYEKLVHSNILETRNMAKEYRLKIDDLFKNLNCSIPILILITKCDKIEGFNQWINCIPKDSYEQAMGYSSTKEKNIGEFVNEAITSVSSRIKDISLSLNSLENVSYKVINFPQKFHLIKPYLTEFANTFFYNKITGINPDLFGIYFTGTDIEKRDKYGLAVSPFLKDIFIRILPACRNYVISFIPPQKTKTIIEKCFSSAWVLISAFLIFLLCWTYVSNINELNHIRSQYKDSIKMKDTLKENIYALYEMRQFINSTEEAVNSWYIPWFFFVEQPEFIDKMKKQFVNHFSHDLQAVIDDNFIISVESLIDKIKKSNTDNKITQKEFNSLNLIKNTGQYISATALRINFIHSFLNGANEQELISSPSPFIDLIFPEPLSNVFLNKFNMLYIQRLCWTKDNEFIRIEKVLMQSLLTELLQAGPKDLSWLIPFSNESIKNEKVIRISDFWNGSQLLEFDNNIPSAFTKNGKKYIDDFIYQLRLAAPDQEEFNNMELAFYKLYKKSYIKAWESFINDFDKGLLSLNSRNEWSELVEQLGNIEKNPYFAIMDKIYNEFEPFHSDTNNPEWLRLIHVYQKMKNQNNQIQNKQITQELSNQKINPEQILNDSSYLFNEYKKALISLSKIVNKPELSYKMMSNFFLNSTEPDPQIIHEAKASKTISDIKNLLGHESMRNKYFWKLYSGPLNVIREYMLQETSCLIQQNWEDAFLSKIKGIPENKLNDFMFGETGLVWSFLNTNLAPFISKVYGKGYVTTRTNDMIMPLRHEFLDFLSQNLKTKQRPLITHNVIITAFPTSVNHDALAQPHLTSLTLVCENTSQVLANYNIESQKQIKWSSKCDFAKFAISIKDIVLEREYYGSDSFPAFIKDFKHGTKRFTPDDFPHHMVQLEAMNINYIDVTYGFIAHEPVLQYLNDVYISVPKQISYCWEDIKYSDKYFIVADDESDSETLKYKKQIYQSQKQQELIHEKEKADIEKEQTQTQIKTEIIVSKNEESEKVNKNKEIDKDKDKDKDKEIDKDKDKVGEKKQEKIIIDTKDYILQVASFREMERAVQLREKFLKKDYETEVYWLKDSRGRKWFIVGIGLYDDLKSAKNAANSFKNRETYLPLIRTFKPGMSSQRKVNLNGY